jgi:hypothetical protein
MRKLVPWAVMFAPVGRSCGRRGWPSGPAGSMCRRAGYGRLDVPACRLAGWFGDRVVIPDGLVRNRRRSAGNRRRGKGNLMRLVAPATYICARPGRGRRRLSGPASGTGEGAGSGSGGTKWRCPPAASGVIYLRGRGRDPDSSGRDLDRSGPDLGRGDRGPDRGGRHRGFPGPGAARRARAQGPTSSGQVQRTWSLLRGRSAPARGAAGVCPRCRPHGGPRDRPAPP